MNQVLKISVLGSFFLMTGLAAAQENTLQSEKPFTKVLLVKWKEGIGSADKTEVTQIFRSLVKEIDGLDSFQIKALQADRYETGYFLNFRSSKAEQAYQAHKKHKQLLSLAPDLVDDVFEYRYWN